MSATLADTVIQSIDWSAYELLGGPADGFGDQLAAFITVDADNYKKRWKTMENHVFAQDDIYSAAEPTIRVLLAALLDPRGRSARIGILDLLFLITQAASYREDEFGARCLQLVREGSWLLIREALASAPPVSDACLEVLDICAPECADIARLGALVDV
ncbi:hypothetical protein E1263_24165 [Kribbella antibiotica]|uniref:Uncharacterized protein n=1 Tax=Kribbella antibiotica TaxID=190195 RepID=A0A4R4ZFS0_9ACTN|nr:hypothetical protein [Kribbella antibiotica]TDD57333.1 hypothetical protein E1263_24165 [Kribbella antibiotica]